ncbi:Cellulose-growth-specific protein [Trametes pubescens]|uniref:AA9 family lytic polysaccharide monooxygenase n=1 Tax=Trametes pubescens TaxID=154538 RepID=A0A1M2VMM3_TRAPU|nr:Cellulose-growth-specific protein [Trametes pubescens]
MFVTAVLTTLALAVTQVAAHGGVLSYQINGQIYQGFKAYNTPVGQTSIQRERDTYNPITDPTDGSLACNTNGASLGSAQQSATVAAGSKVVAYWNEWPHALGPVMIYMANCNGACTSATPSSLDWFKIEHSGLLSGSLPNGQWAQGQLIANNNSWTTTIPASLKAGEYFLRHELLAIHTSNQPQFYPECAQLKVTVGAMQTNFQFCPSHVEGWQGSGSAQPSGSYLVKFPGAYKMCALSRVCCPAASLTYSPNRSDPGVGIDVYSQPVSNIFASSGLGLTSHYRTYPTTRSPVS